jgi:hypothetical protein
MSTDESVAAIVTEASANRSNLGALDQAIQAEIDEIVRTAARAGREMSEAEKARSRDLQDKQARVEDAFTELAFATLVRLNNSADIAAFKGKLDAINSGLGGDLKQLQTFARYAAIAAQVADGLAQLATKVASLAV